MSRARMPHEGAAPGNPLAAPVTRLEFYVVILVALGTKTLPYLVPAGAALVRVFWP